MSSVDLHDTPYKSDWVLKGNCIQWSINRCIQRFVLNGLYCSKKKRKQNKSEFNTSAIMNYSGLTGRPLVSLVGYSCSRTILVRPEKIKPKYYPPGLRSLGQFPTRTTTNQNQLISLDNSITTSIFINILKQQKQCLINSTKLGLLYFESRSNISKRLMLNKISHQTYLDVTFSFYFSISIFFTKNS